MKVIRVCLERGEDQPSEGGKQSLSLDHAYTKKSLTNPKIEETRAMYR